MSDKYDVGYKKPPRHGQFKKGQSGNPSGRPPKESKDLKTMVEEVFQQNVVVLQGDTKTSVPVLKAIVMKHANKALQGDTKSLEQILKLIEKNQLLLPPPADADGNKPSGFAWTEEHETFRPFIEHLINDGKHNGD